jgi:protein NrfD
MTEVDLFRANAHIDPHLSIWGWEIPVYLFLGGVSAGVMILSAVIAMRRGGDDDARLAPWIPFTVPVLMSAGMLALFLDLAYKLHVLRFYLAFKPASPMSWGSWILLAVYPATILLGLAALTPEERERLAGWIPLRGLARLTSKIAAQAATRLRALAWINLIVGVGLGIYTGVLLGSLGARPVWSSAVLGPLFLCSGISTGAAFLMLFPLRVGIRRLVLRWDQVAIVFELLLLGLFLLGLWTGGRAEGMDAARLFLGGRFTALFWSLVVMVGLLVPFALELVEERRALRATRVAPALILTGGLALRWILVVAGQA